MTLTADHREQVLEMFEHFNKKGIALIDKEDYICVNNKKIIELNKYIVKDLPELFLDWRWQDRFKKLCLERHLEHPVEFLFQKFNKFINGESLFDNIQHDYVKKLEKRQEKRTEKTSKPAQKTKEEKKTTTSKNNSEDLFE